MLITVRQIKSIIRECITEINQSTSPMMKIMTLDQFISTERPTGELDEAGDMLGINKRTVSHDELNAYLAKGRAGEKTTTDRMNMPYVHKNNVVVKSDDGKTFDLDKLKLAITTRPSSILKQNEKISHSGGDATIYYNIGLPALKGLAVNEATGEFVVVDTCPGAGACKVYCYAMQGGYIQWKAASMSQTRVLNFLLNDPAGFKETLEAELLIQRAKFGRSPTGQKNSFVVRWHDAGDFFSPDYLELAYSIARKFPDMNFYAYTKVANVATGEKPANFQTNFSGGAKPEQEKQVDFKTVKHAIVVPKQVFDDLIELDADGKKVKDNKNRVQFSPENLTILKSKLALKYDIESNSIIMYDDLMAKPITDKPLYNVIVRPGDGDDAASRPDVLGTYLLIHK